MVLKNTQTMTLKKKNNVNLKFQGKGGGESHFADYLDHIYYKRTETSPEESAHEPKYQ